MKTRANISFRRGGPRAAAPTVASFTFLLLTLTTAVCSAQSSGGKSPSGEIDFKIVSIELQRFRPPIRIGEGKTALRYEEAMVLKIAVDQRRFDELPPDIEPFLYVGGVELRPFKIERSEKTTLTLVFHASNWAALKDGSRIVLTILHGAPAVEPKRFDRAGAPRFDRSMIVDKRG